MSNTLSLDYAVAKKILRAMETMINNELSAVSGSVRSQIIDLQQIRVPSTCEGNYKEATVEKLVQLNRDWQDLILHIRDCKIAISKKVEQLHAYDMELQAKAQNTEK